MKHLHGAAALLGALALGVTATAAAAQTVTVWTFLDPSKATGRDRAFKELITQFEAANPGITIKVEPQVFSELGAKFLLGHRTGTAPDVVFVNAENLGAVVKSNATADLEKAFIAGWPAGADGDFYMRAAWDAAKVDGGRYAVPLFPATATIFYRKDLFAQAGIDPATLKTWDQLTDAAKKLTKDTNGDGTPDVWGIGAPLSVERTAGTTAIVPMIQSGQPEVWDGAACTPHYATPAGEKAIATHAGWITTDKVMPREALVNNTDDLLEQFAAGRYAMVVAPFARYENAVKSATWNGAANLAVMPWPTWDGARSGPQIVTGWFLAAWRNSKNLAAATTFIDYLISKDGVLLWSTVGGQVPTRSSVFDDPKFQTPQFAYMRTMQKAWSDWSFMLPTRCNTARFDADLNAAVHRVVLGEADAAKALKEAEAKFTERQ
ncbi:ABC transporter substrate-binding protein [Ancylobacter terrae]|uniref:ABC transporter substrate-binding protein n=1 Tax=Ancylobacter sp. sgz301288 TaxID=3342077 RepID=UPI00385E317F